MKKLSKIDKKIFEGLNEKLSESELSKDKGEIKRSKNPQINSKIRRHSGRREIFCDDEDYPFQECFYDDWRDFRDGMRDINNIKTKEIKEKIKKEQSIRKIQQKKEEIK